MSRTQAQVFFENSGSALEENAIVFNSIGLADSFSDFPQAAVESWRYEFVKRSIDFVSSLILAAILAVPGLLIAAVILLTSEGPVFYREQRIGRYGKPFQILKFRSMYQDAAQRAKIAEAQAGPDAVEWRMHKHLHDPRITPVGGILRKSSLDEIPQIINVLRGEMSLVGPRPIVQAETPFYGDLLSHYLAATPGLSGLWQVSGRSQIGYEERARLDATYVRTWGLRTDLLILLRTIPVVVGRVGAR